ncbi:MAG TPA: hypothetical protein PLH43_11565 [Acetivibrio sp.]|uniref:hypothetical protein n=1 Tax=Acetivibrio sp. TaxID=1872092 RepID=UPI002D14A491|nr:hypothetical protein [Acetivibrio sp.]HOM03447.1 hypothetical protein [Acetivibrio sp.]
MKKCPNCGGENNEFNSFCEWCGGKIPETMEIKSEYSDGVDDNFGSNGNINSRMNTNYSPSYDSMRRTTNYNTAESDNAGILSLVFGILSLFCCAVVFGPLAIVKGNESNSTLGKVGKVLGIVGLGLWALLLVARVLRRLA